MGMNEIPSPVLPLARFWTKAMRAEFKATQISHHHLAAWKDSPLLDSLLSPLFPTPRSQIINQLCEPSMIYHLVILIHPLQLRNSG
jgi:hypothetical protein